MTIAEVDLDRPGPVTLECGVDPRCGFQVTNTAAVAEAAQWRHERRHQLPRIHDVEASPAWRQPYAATETHGDHQ